MKSNLCYAEPVCDREQKHLAYEVSVTEIPEFHTTLLAGLHFLNSWLNLETEILQKVSTLFFLATYHEEFAIFYLDKFSTFKNT